MERKDLEIKLKGLEPVYAGKIEIEKAALASCLNWYNQWRDHKQLRTYTVQYLKAKKLVKPDVVDKIAKLPDHLFSTVGAVCRMIDRGAILSTKHKIYVNEKIEQLTFMTSAADTNEDESAPAKPKVDIQKLVWWKAMNMCGEIDHAIDEDKTQEGFAYAIFVEQNAKPMHLARIIEVYKKERAEYEEVLTGNCEQLNEAYADLNKNHIKKLIKVYQSIIDDAQKLSAASIADRPARKKKAKTPEQLTSKVVVMEEFPELKLKGILPTEVIGAQHLYAYNTKTRKLTHFVADDSAGLTWSRASVFNFNYAVSSCKTVRKPELVIPKLLKAGKVELRKLMDGIKSKKKAAKGRLNAQTILLKVTS